MACSSRTFRQAGQRASAGFRQPIQPLADDGLPAGAGRGPRRPAGRPRTAGGRPAGWPGCGLRRRAGPERRLLLAARRRPRQQDGAVAAGAPARGRRAGADAARHPGRQRAAPRSAAGQLRLRRPCASWAPACSPPRLSPPRDPAALRAWLAVLYVAGSGLRPPYQGERDGLEERPLVVVQGLLGPPDRLGQRAVVVVVVVVVVGGGGGSSSTGDDDGWRRPVLRRHRADAFKFKNLAPQKKITINNKKIKK